LVIEITLVTETTGNMQPFRSLIVSVAIIHARFIAADSYANNQNPTVVDAPQVVANFAAIEGVELLSPAFINPGSVPITFANGTSGPTSQYTLGEYVLSDSSESLTECRTLLEGSLKPNGVDYVPRWA
jgi:hypothetical protein